MILGKVDLTEHTDMVFGIDVFGTTEQTKSVRFVIEGDDFDVLCKCQVANGEVTATIPKLKGILKSGLHEARLEVVVGDKLFVPLSEQIEINPLVEVVAEAIGAEPHAGPTVVAKVRAPAAASLSPPKKPPVPTTPMKPQKEKVNPAQVKTNTAPTTPPESLVNGVEYEVKKALKEGCEIVQYDEYFLVKSGDHYVGIVTESGIMKSKTPCITVLELIDSLSK